MLSQHVAVGRRAGKGSAETNAFRIWPPENDTDIKTTRNRPIEYIEQGAAAVRHDKIGRAKRRLSARCYFALAQSPRRYAETSERRRSAAELNFHRGSDTSQTLAKGHSSRRPIFVPLTGAPEHNHRSTVPHIVMR